MRVSAEKLEEIKASLAKRTIAALDEREGRQARDYQLARETDAGLTVGQALAIVDDLEESREQQRVLREALEHYGAHNSDCAVIVSVGVCSCGLEEALAATENGNG